MLIFFSTRVECKTQPTYFNPKFVGLSYYTILADSPILYQSLMDSIASFPLQLYLCF